MFPLPNSTTADRTLDATLARLSRHPSVDALVTVGSTGSGALTAASDYDVLIVLTEMAVPLHVGITYIDHRLTDLLFATTEDIETIIAAAEPIDSDAWAGRIARWLPTSTVVFDRRGRVGLALAKVGGVSWIRPLEQIDSYGAWIGVSYNLLHTRRMMQSDDPVYQHAAELRISLYGIGSMLLSYFRVRNLLWEGDKEAVRYLHGARPGVFCDAARAAARGRPAAQAGALRVARCCHARADRRGVAGRADGAVERRRDAFIGHGGARTGAVGGAARR